MIGRKSRSNFWKICKILSFRNSVNICFLSNTTKKPYVLPSLRFLTKYRKTNAFSILIAKNNIGASSNEPTPILIIYNYFFTLPCAFLTSSIKIFKSAAVSVSVCFSNTDNIDCSTHIPNCKNSTRLNLCPLSCHAIALQGFDLSLQSGEVPRLWTQVIISPFDAASSRIISPTDGT